MTRLPWYSVGRLVGTVEPLIWIPAVDYHDALTWAAVHTEIRKEQLIVAPVWIEDLPPVPNSRTLRRALEEGGEAAPTSRWGRKRQ